MIIRYQSFKTAQISVHPSLVTTVKKYAKSEFLRPIPSHQLDVFLTIEQFIKKTTAPLIIDSGCGTGHSSLNLAQMYPDHLVIGIDKSFCRLKRGSAKNPGNLFLVRGELIDLWRLLAKAKLSIKRHYLFYPNPWPKIGHLKRRFHAHPIFHTMVSLAPYFELRTNWDIYAKECYTALKVLGKRPSLSLKTDNEPISLFEKKYLKDSCSLYIVKFDDLNG